MGNDSLIASTTQFQTLLIALVLIVAVIYFFIELRKSYGMNQTKFAKMLGYTNKSYISQMETGYRKVPKQVAFLCNLLMEKRD